MTIETTLLLINVFIVMTIVTLSLLLVEMIKNTVRYEIARYKRKKYAKNRRIKTDQ